MSSSFTVLLTHTSRPWEWEKCRREYLAERYALHAGIDISDGLTLDLWRLAQESGCGAVLDLSAIPVSDAAHQLAAQQPGASALDHALSDGEDFELLLAVQLEEAERMCREQPLDVPITQIGRCIAQPGLYHKSDGNLTPLPPRGCTGHRTPGQRRERAAPAAQAPRSADSAGGVV